MASAPKPARPFAGLTRNTLLLAFASLFADIATEMLYPVLPVFLTQTLKASGSVVGLVEGVATGRAEYRAGLLRLAVRPARQAKARGAGGLSLGRARQAADRPCLKLARGVWARASSTGSAPACARRRATR